MNASNIRPPARHSWNSLTGRTSYHPAKARRATSPAGGDVDHIQSPLDALKTVRQPINRVVLTTSGVHQCPEHYLQIGQPALQLPQLLGHAVKLAVEAAQPCQHH